MQDTRAVRTDEREYCRVIDNTEGGNPKERRISDQLQEIGYAESQRGFGWTNAVYLMFVNRLFDRL